MTLTRSTTCLPFTSVHPCHTFCLCRPSASTTRCLIRNPDHRTHVLRTLTSTITFSQLPHSYSPLSPHERNEHRWVPSPSVTEHLLSAMTPLYAAQLRPTVDISSGTPRTAYLLWLGYIFSTTSPCHTTSYSRPNSLPATRSLCLLHPRNSYPSCPTYFRIKHARK